MYLLSVVVFSLTAYSTSAVNKKLPDFIAPCDYNDKKINECIWDRVEKSLPHFAKGIPDYEIPPMDPIALNDIHIDQNNLNISFKDPKMYGMSNLKLKDLQIDIRSQIEADFVVVYNVDIKIKGNYSADGQFLFIPIKGVGEATITIKDMEVNLKSRVKRTKDKDNHHHMKLTSPVYKYDIASTVFELTNLFNGNKALADTTHQVANENWKILLDEFAPAVIDDIITTLIKAINIFCNNIPLENMVLNYPETSV